MSRLRYRLHQLTRSITLILLSATLLQAIASANDTRFVLAGETPVTASDGTLLGQLGLGTRVAVVAEADGALEVVLEGWSMAAGPSAVFLSNSQRILLASLTDEGQSAAEVLDSAPDAFDTVWNHVRIMGMVDPTAVGEDMTETWAAGDILLQERCGACHATPRPEQYTVNQWPGTIASMVPSYVALTDEELEHLRKFVQYHASDM